MICVTNLAKNWRNFFFKDKKKLESKDLNSNMFLFLKKKKKWNNLLRQHYLCTPHHWQNPFIKFILIKPRSCWSFSAPWLRIVVIGFWKNIIWWNSKRRANGIIFYDTMGEERNQILNLPFLYIVLIFSLKIRLDVEILNVSNKGHAPFTSQV